MRVNSIFCTFAIRFKFRRVTDTEIMQDNAPKHPVNRGSRFIKDFGIYALGNIGMKLITFMLVPLYTYFVDNPGDYGYFDMCLAACFLLMPIMTLQMRDGSYRFLVNNKDEAYRKGLISFVYKALLGNIMLEILIATGMALFYPVRCLWYTVALLVTMSVFEVMIQMIGRPTTTAPLSPQR